MNRRSFLKGLFSLLIFEKFLNTSNIFSTESSKLPTAPLGKTGFKITKLGFGAAQIGSIDKSNAFKTLQTAIDEGINYFDTASTYGLSEERIGEFFGKNKNDILITTKVLSRSKKEASGELTRSLKRLKSDCIDIVHLHAVNTISTLKEVFSKDGAFYACLDFQKRNYIKFIGITNHNNPDVLKEAIKMYPFANILIPTGICDKILGSYEDLIIQLKKTSGVVGMKVFGAGEYKNKLDFEKCLRYCLGLDVDSTIVGFSNPEEVKTSCKILKNFLKMSDEEIKEFTDEATKYADKKIMWWRN